MLWFSSSIKDRKFLLGNKKWNTLFEDAVLKMLFFQIFLCLSSLVFCKEFAQMHAKEIALVTGASSGIGKALVEQLIAQDYEVIGIARSADNLEKVKAAINNDSFSVYACDVANLENVRQISNELKNSNKIPKYFFLNAGTAGIDAVESTDVLDLSFHQKMFAVNYYGVLNFVEEWLTAAIENGGATFAVTNSINATFAPPGGSAYSASKAAIAKAFDGLRLTYKQNNLKFLSVFCGPVDTPGLAGKLPYTWPSKKMAQYMIKRVINGKAHSNPSWFYSILCKLLNVLPEKQVFSILKVLVGNQS